MSGKRAKQQRRAGVLSDHTKVGKVLVPPMVQQFGDALREVSWLDEMVPELLWMALLETRYDGAKGTELALALAQAASACMPGRWFGTTSSFEVLTADDWVAVRAGLDATGHLGALVKALDPFVAHYPACPLGGLIARKNAAEPHPVDGEYLAYLAAVVDELAERGDRRATLIQGCYIYLGLALRQVVLTEGMSLNKLPELESYPETETSREVASAVRGAVNAFMGLPEGVGATWAPYFWNRGLALTPCEVGDERT